MIKAIQKFLYRLTELLMEYPLIATGVFFLLYVVFFTIAEGAKPANVFLIDLPIDHWIPFTKYASVLYCTWHLEIVAILLCYRYSNDRDEYWNLACKLLLGLFMILLICVLFPNEVRLRPASVEGTDFFARLTRMVYAADTSQNVFPSGHAFASIIMAQGWHRIANKRWKSMLSVIGNTGIVLSTFLLKQHSVVDAFGGILLAFLVDAVIDRIMERRKQRVQSESYGNFPHFMI